MVLARALGHTLLSNHPGELGVIDVVLRDDAIHVLHLEWNDFISGAALSSE